MKTTSDCAQYPGLGACGFRHVDVLTSRPDRYVQSGERDSGFVGVAVEGDAFELPKLNPQHEVATRALSIGGGGLLKAGSPEQSANAASKRPRSSASAQCSLTVLPELRTGSARLLITPQPSRSIASMIVQ